MDKGAIYYEKVERSDAIMRKNVLKAERERIEGAKTISVEEARRRLRERVDKI